MFSYVALSRRLLYTTALTAFVVFTGQAAFANPEDGNVVAGSATIGSSGPNLDIIQHTDRAVIDWRSFNIGVDEQTRFYQPNSNSIVVNRVSDANPSQILGKLSANGNVVLINPNGVFFGQGSVVDVNGMLATTADIDNNKFMSGSLHFDKAGNPNASIINNGQITAKEAGLVGLVAPNVVNNGVITARLGRVELVSGDTVTVDFRGNGITEIAVTDDVKSQMISNTGQVNAAGGTIAITAAAGKNIVNSLIDIKGELRAPAVSQKNGKIQIFSAGSNAVAGNKISDKGIKSGNSTVLVSGNLDATGKNGTEKGGSIEITGDHVAILEGAKIDASGNTGGGVIKVGGDYLGGGTTPTASRVIVQNNASILSNAFDNGKGGSVTVWSDYRTDFSGLIEAKGGANGGDGGFVETSGKQFLNASGFVDATAKHGMAGIYLLDPNNVTIQTSGSNTNVTGSPNFTTTGDGAIITTGSIQAILNAGTNVTITTGGTGSNAGDIFVNNTITKTAGGNALLTLSAYRNITIAATISSTFNQLGVSLIADNMSNGLGYITVSSGVSILSNGGAISMTGGTGYAVGHSSQISGILITGTLNASGGNISLSGRGSNGTAVNNHGISNTGSIITNGSGVITLSGAGGGTSSGSNYGISNTGTVSVVDGQIIVTNTRGGNSGGSNHGLYISGTGSFRATGTGSITITATGGGSSGNSNYGVLVDSSNGTISANGGAISITGIGGNSTGSYNGGIQNVGYITNVGTGTITLTGTGSGTGTSDNYGISNYATISSVNGDITMNGTGGNATGNSNHGINNAGGAILTAGTGNINITGNGGGSGNSSSNYGVYLNATNAIRTTGSGNVIITGLGGNSLGSGSGNMGIYSYTANPIQTNGIGTISLIGTGSHSASGYNHGVYINQAFSGNGSNISITGTGGNLGVGNAGIILTSSFGITTMTNTGSGSITLTGIAGGTSGNSSDNRGIYISANYISTVDGNITINGTAGGAGSGTDNTGIYISGRTLTTGSGNISITGTGGNTNGSGGSNFGVHLGATDAVKTTGTGSITIYGTGGNNSGSGANNHGVNITGSIASSAGAISISGIGGNSTGNTNYGIFNRYGSITATGIASITLSGVGGGNNGNSDSNYGIFHVGYISTVDGNLTVTQAKGGGAGTGSNNYGYYVQLGYIRTTGIGNLSITATGGNSGTLFSYSNHGIYGGTTGAIQTTGTGSITLVGTGGNGSGTGSTNTGVYVSSGSITSAGGALNITGTGSTSSGNDNYGIYVGGSSTAAITNTGVGSITLSGTGGGTGNSSNNYGVYVYQGNVSTQNGDLIVTMAQGGGAGSGTNNSGLFIAAGYMSTSGSGNIHITGRGTNSGGSGSDNHGIRNGNNIRTTGTGTITLIGTGGETSGSSNYGVYNNGSISSNGGDVSLTGTGRSGTSSSGIFSGSISNLGTGSITLSGTGGGTGNSSASGIYVYGHITTIDGSIIVHNTKGGGSGTGSNNYGFTVSGGSLRSTGLGNISVTATGGNDAGTGSSNFGIAISGAVSAAGGTITLNGTGSNSSGANNSGVYIGNYLTNTGSGTITVTGIGGGSLNSGTNYGIQINYSSAALVTAVDGNITLNGTGGGAGTGANNYGFYNTQITVWSYYSTVRTSGTGNILLTATGGNTSGSGSDNYGAYLSSLNSFQTTGTGSVSVTGTGGNASGSSANNHGIYLNIANTISTAGGNITLNGTGGGYTGATNYGVFLLNSTVTLNGNGGALSITGTGGNSSGNANYGIYNNGSLLNTGTGTIMMAGTGGGRTTSASNYGTYLNNGIVRTTGTGAISITGVGGNGSGGLNHGLATAWATISNTGAGGITLSGTSGQAPGTPTGSNDSYGMTFSSSTSIGTTTTTGDIRLMANSLSYVSTVFDTDGSLILGSTSGNNLRLVSALTLVHDKNIVVENSINSFSSTPVNLSLTSNAGGITFNSGLGTTQKLGNVNLVSTNEMTLPSVTANSIFAQTTGTTSDMRIASGSILTASNTGSAITLVAKRNFINVQGANALQTTHASGRWLVYSTQFSSDTTGGLVKNFYRYGCTYGGSCPTLGTGNGFLYTVSPTLTATASQITVTYGDTVSLTGYAYTLTGYGDQAEADLDSIIGSLNGSTTYAQGANVGNYNIDRVNGTLTSSTGYTIVYANNAQAIVVNPRTLTLVSGITANSKTYDGTDAASLALGSVNLSNKYGSDNVTIDLANAAALFDNANVGNNKTVSVSGLGLTGTAAGNYVLASSTASLQANVTTASLSVKANDKTMTYGDGNSYNGYSITSGTLFGSDAISTVALSSNATSSVSNNWNTGDYTITASGATGVGLNNYTITYQTGDLKINTKSIQVKANDLTIKATENANFTYGFNAADFVSGEDYTTAGITGSASVLHPINISALTPGNYNLELDLIGLSSQNYHFVEQMPRGVLTVNALPVPPVNNNIQNIIAAVGKHEAFTYKDTSHLNTKEISILYDNVIQKKIMTMNNSIIIHPQLRKELKIERINMEDTTSLIDNPSL